MGRYLTRVPRACGDGPFIPPASEELMRCSPRMRGWTAHQVYVLATVRVFPAHAGMDQPP